MPDQPNILFVTVDSLRADHVYGDRTDTPALDGLIDDGTAFESAFAQGPYTTFSMPSLFTSRYPSQLTSIDFVDGVEGVLVDGVETVQTALGEAGYTTAGIHTNPLLSELFGFDVGFDHFDDGLGGLSDRLPGRLTLVADKIERLVSRHPYVPADTLTDRAITWLQQNDSEPFFLWVHYMDVHGPYQSGDGFPYVEKYRSEMLWRKAVHDPDTVTAQERERLRETYIEEVEFTDRHIGRLLEAFDTNEGMVAVTADHGEEFFEHGSYSHESKLYDELIHVPLIVDPPNESEPLDRDEESLVPLLAVGPTLLDAGNASASEFAGTSLFAETPHKSEPIEGPGGPHIVSEARLDPAYIGAVRTADWKYIDNEGEPELYDLSEDPAESTDVYGDTPDIGARLEQLLADHRDRYSGQRRGDERLDTGELDDQLRSLGYLE